MYLDLCKIVSGFSSEKQIAIMSMENEGNALLHNWEWRSVYRDEGDKKDGRKRYIIYTICQLWKEIEQIRPEFLSTLV